MSEIRGAQSLSLWSKARFAFPHDLPGSSLRCFRRQTLQALELWYRHWDSRANSSIYLEMSPLTYQSGQMSRTRSHDRATLVPRR